MDNEVLEKMKHTYGSGLSMASISFGSPSFTQTGWAGSFYFEAWQRMEENGNQWLHLKLLGD